MSDEKPQCFIIMPIKTPKESLNIYFSDDNHFGNVLNHLFIPAVEKAGFEPVPPKSVGSNIIHADIITQLSQADLVLCDMSNLNPNVFFEFGIRAALNKPVALVVDDVTDNSIPFDISPINYHVYKNSPTWDLDEELIKLSTHIKESFEKSDGQNSLWKHFGVTQTGTFSPENVTLEEKIDFLIREVSLFRETSSLNERRKAIEDRYHQEINAIESEYELRKKQAIKDRNAIELANLDVEFEKKKNAANLMRAISYSELNSEYNP